MLQVIDMGNVKMVTPDSKPSGVLELRGRIEDDDFVVEFRNADGTWSTLFWIDSVIGVLELETFSALSKELTYLKRRGVAMVKRSRKNSDMQVIQVND